jgi:outer membrane protein
MKRCLLLAAVFAHGLFPAWGQRPVKLKEGLMLALENSAQVRKAALDREGVELRLKEGRSAMYPQITGTLGMDYFPALPNQLYPGEVFGQAGGTYVPIQIGRPWQMSGGVLLEQQIYNESMRRAIPAMNTTRAIFDLLGEKAEEEVIFTTATVFYQILQTEQLHRSVNANLSKLEALERMAQLQLANGYAIPTDVKRIKVARTNLETQRQNLYSGINSLRQTLQFLCGVPFEAPFDPVEEVSNPLADSSRWISLSLEPESTTEHRLILRNVELNRINLRSLRAANMPVLSGYASAFSQSFRSDPFFADPGMRWFGTASTGLRLKIPFFDGFRRHRKADLLELDGMKLEEDRRQVDRAKNLEFLQAHDQLKTAIRALRTQADNVTLAREIGDKLFLQYKEGVVSLTDLLNAQTALSESESNYWQQVFGYKLSILKLLKAAGRLEDLK